MLTQIKNDMNQLMDDEVTRTEAMTLWFVLTVISGAFLGWIGILALNLLEVIRWFKNNWRIEVKRVNE